MKHTYACTHRGRRGQNGGMEVQAGRQGGGPRVSHPVDEVLRADQRQSSLQRRTHQPGCTRTGMRHGRRAVLGARPYKGIYLRACVVCVRACVR